MSRAAVSFSYTDGIPTVSCSMEYEVDWLRTIRLLDSAFSGDNSALQELKELKDRKVRIYDSEDMAT